MIQLNIEVADKAGELSKIIAILAQEKIDLKALYLGEKSNASNTGIVKVILTDVDKAFYSLKEKGFHATKENVVVTALEDHPGGLNSILTTLSLNNINIKHIYSFVSRIEGKALSVFGFDDPQSAITVLQNAKVRIIENTNTSHDLTTIPEPDLSAYLGGVFYW